MNPNIQIPDYVIRCGDSGNLIDCRVEDYNKLINQGYSIEEALNKLGIFKECCRTRFIVPSKAFLRLENRKLIEGRIPYSSNLQPDKEVIENEGINLGFMIKATPNRSIDDVINVEDFEEEYKYPTEISIPTVNKRDFPNSKNMRFVGAGKYSEVISGSKYLCR